MESEQKPNLVVNKEDSDELQKAKDRRREVIINILIAIGIIGIIVIIIVLVVRAVNKPSSVATGPTYSPNPPT